jgi:membrane protein YqaA with SNARE-associated domain
MIFGLVLANKLWTWVRHLGGPGLVVLGLADNSVVPLPGSMDVLTIYLTVYHHTLWWYYAAMATVGSVIGGYITYRMAAHGGKAALERKIGTRRSKRVYRRFERWGFGSIFIPALLPPPFPFVPFLLAAGALQYSRKKFFAALALGRGLRYGILAYLGVIYGRQFLRFFNKNTKPTVVVLVSLSAIAGAVALFGYFRMRKGEGKKTSGHRKAAHSQA